MLQTYKNFMFRTFDYGIPFAWLQVCYQGFVESWLIVFANVMQVLSKFQTCVITNVVEVSQVQFFMGSLMATGLKYRWILNFVNC